MKKNIMYIILCTIMAFCGHYGNIYPLVCILVAYFCGMFMEMLYPLSKETRDYINKKLN